MSRFGGRSIGLGGFVVAVGALVGFRLLGVYPWNEFVFDLHAYWITRDGLDYATHTAGPAGTYLYSPAFAQAIRPLTLLPLPLFGAIWTALGAVLLVWLVGRRALWVALIPPVLITLVQGQLDLAYAVVAIVGLRWPAAWALPLLTKVSPGVGVAWFLVRREWRNLAIALGVSGLIALVSLVSDPGAWSGWIELLLRTQGPVEDPNLIYLAVPLIVRVPIALAIIAWGAWTDRHWTVPVAMTVAMPILWVNSFTILVALLPLLPAGADSPAGQWLRNHRDRLPADSVTMPA
ncbi:MAG TPA: glycosyltransferase 87 family protein [Candidatus Limnocylindrales bacterium]|nr:glycosyltransferase 87 family protein [Candidatus Limnocylindrales bacterium]